MSITFKCVRNCTTLTVTKVVFESQNWTRYRGGIARLTVTKVVFESNIPISKGDAPDLGLTVTKVVFESKGYIIDKNSI